MIRKRGLTFSDITVLPRVTDILPEQVSLKTKITKGENGIQLNIPILSAAMDTITEHKMAIALAQSGCLGAIHRACSIEEQVREVRKVKSETWFMVKDPISLYPKASLALAKKIMEEKNISGIPVVEEGSQRLVNIVTKRDVRFPSDMDLKRRVGNFNTRSLVTISDKYVRDEDRIKQLFQECRIEKLPVINQHGQLVGLITLKDFEKRGRYPLAVLDANGCLMVGAAIGVGDSGLQRAEALIEAGADLLIIDSAHGNALSVREAVVRIKKRWPEIPIMAGNVATAETTIALIDAGADVVKVGIGSGSICTTRAVTGVGRPQVTAIIDCVGNTGRGIPLIADGGFKVYGDVSKALVLGAAAIMTGKFFAGTDETPGTLEDKNGSMFKEYRGMGCASLINKAGFDRYLQNKVPEGVETKVPYKGSVEKIVLEIANTLKSTLADLGCSSIEELHRLIFSRRIWEEMTFNSSIREGFSGEIDG